LLGHVDGPGIDMAKKLALLAFADDGFAAAENLVVDSLCARRKRAIILLLFSLLSAPGTGNRFEYESLSTI
ncbi:MAG: hypothetical protein NTW95_13395, partial [Candidatus Aminicenantes bacterium]|nr:hypothetical protein [Candidatus Aminicenantes bacterium]